MGVQDFLDAAQANVNEVFVFIRLAIFYALTIRLSFRVDKPVSVGRKFTKKSQKKYFRIFWLELFTHVLFLICIGIFCNFVTQELFCWMWTNDPYPWGVYHGVVVIDETVDEAEFYIRAWRDTANRRAEREEDFQ